MRGALLLATLLAACGGPIRSDGAVDDDAGRDAATAWDAAADAAQDAGVDGGADAGELDGGDGGPPGPLRVVQLSDHCALRSDGDVRCWGEGREGQLGNGELVSSDAAVRAQLPGPASDVGCSAQHCCAVLDGGEVRCWGSNVGGELGRDGGGVPARYATPVSTVFDGAARLVAAGPRTTCVVDDAHEVWCWGTWITEEADSSRWYMPRHFDIVGARPPTRLAVGSGTACAIAPAIPGGELTAFCWGANDRDQAGDAVTGDFYDRGYAARLCEDVMLSGSTYCASGGELFCWGRTVEAADSCAGRGFGFTSAPALDGFADVTATRAGCALLADGSLRCIQSGGATPRAGRPGAFDVARVAAGPCVTDGTGVYCGGVAIAGVMD